MEMFSKGVWHPVGVNARQFLEWFERIHLALTRVRQANVKAEEKIEEGSKPRESSRGLPLEVGP